MPLNSNRFEAIVLSRVNYGEADRILKLLTPDGKISVIAKGVRREKSKLAGGIELLAICDVTVQRGRGDLAILTSARLEQFFSHILTDYERLQFAYYVLKDIAKTAEIIDEPAFYELTKQALASLDDKDIPLAVTELWYRLQMAILLGVGINLATDENGMKLVEDTTYRYDKEMNSFAYDPQGQYTSDHIKLLRVASAQNPRIITQIKNLDQLLSPASLIGQIAHE